MIVTMLMPVKSQPRYRKRIKALLSEGFDVSSLFFERNYFKGEEIPCPSICIGNLSHGGYLGRFFTLLKAAYKVRKHTDNTQTLYCFGMDMLFLAFLAGRSNRKVVYEIADIRPVVLEKSLRGIATRTIERLLLRTVDILVVTAPGYISGYYSNLLSTKAMPECLVIENKIGGQELPPVKDYVAANEQDRINIGYFGLLRCPRSWAVLKQLVSQHPEKFSIAVYGRPIAPPDLAKQAEEIKEISYHGEYLWPTDLQKMYDSVDVVWACYPFGQKIPGNWQWAMTNRFYESCYFKKPLIALRDSADATRVKSFDIGEIIDLSDTDNAVAWIVENITKERLSYFSKNLESLSPSSFLYIDEHGNLANLIRCPLL